MAAVKKFKVIYAIPAFKKIGQGDVEDAHPAFPEIGPYLPGKMDLRDQHELELLEVLRAHAPGMKIPRTLRKKHKLKNPKVTISAQGNANN
ncbi:hypothetical protein RUND412_002598 [Rhizina undulata]